MDSFFSVRKKSRHYVFKKCSPLHSASAFFKTLFLNKIPVSRISMTSAVVPIKIYPLFMVDVLQFPHRCYFCENFQGKGTNSLPNESVNSYATRETFLDLPNLCVELTLIKVTIENRCLQCATRSLSIYLA